MRFVYKTMLKQKKNALVIIQCYAMRYICYLYCGTSVAADGFSCCRIMFLVSILFCMVFTCAVISV